MKRPWYSLGYLSHGTLSGGSVLVGGAGRTPRSLKLHCWEVKLLPDPFGKDHFSWVVLWSTILLHPWRLTWSRIMEVWKIIFLSKWVICRFQPLIFQGVAINSRLYDNSRLLGLACWQGIFAWLDMAWAQSPRWIHWRIPYNFPHAYCWRSCGSVMMWAVLGEV